VVNAQLNADTPGGSPSPVFTVSEQPFQPSQGSSAARLLPSAGLRARWVTPRQVG
jgi:hypothetical protein